MTTSWLHALLGITHNAKHHKKVCENKETDSPSGIYRMKLPGTCSLSKESEVTGNYSLSKENGFNGNMFTIKGELSYREGTCLLSKESHEKKKKDGDSYFGGVGLLLFGWDSYFLQKGSPGLLLLKP